MQRLNVGSLYQVYLHKVSHSPSVGTEQLLECLVLPREVQEYNKKQGLVHKKPQTIEPEYTNDVSDIDDLV